MEEESYSQLCSSYDSRRFIGFSPVFERREIEEKSYTPPVQPSYDPTRGLGDIPSGIYSKAEYLALRIDALKISNNNGPSEAAAATPEWGKENIPLGIFNGNTYICLPSSPGNNKLCRTTHVPNYIPSSCPPKEKKKRDIVVNRYGRHPASMSLSLYLLSQGGEGKEFSDYVWCEGPRIGPNIFRQATWMHINFKARVVGTPIDAPKQSYFAEVIQFPSPCGMVSKVITCVPFDDQNVNVSTENSLKCVICDCNQIYHPSSKYCIADESLMNPYDYEEISYLFTREMRGCDPWSDA